MNLNRKFYLYLYFLKYSLSTINEGKYSSRSKKIILFIYLAASGLSCTMRDLCCGMWDVSLQHAGFSLVVACGLQSIQAQ